jgi:hypothetical protein
MEPIKSFLEVSEWQLRLRGLIANEVMEEEVIPDGDCVVWYELKLIHIAYFFLLH